ncbi:MAG: sigma-70 family RNA polymerase sigma factor [Pseudomonadota bacterium]
MAAHSDDIVDQIPSLRRYARALTRHPDRADDLVQDCLERAWRRLHQWRPGSDLRAWLFTIMHNIYANQVRRYCAAPVFVPIEMAEHQHDMTTAAESALHLQELDKAIAELPDGQREVLLLIVLEGMAYEQVAVILDIPIGTVMSRLHRARERLRGWLDGDRSCGLRSVK